MKATKPSASLEENVPSSATAGSSAVQDERPLVSLVVPAYNEASVVAANLSRVCDHMATLSALYRWEVVVVNDGSRDETGRLADEFAANRDNVRVLHHHTNFGLGQAFRYAFTHCRGDYVVTLDVDLSYSPDHIERLLAEICRTRAKVVAASPYMTGGQISNVPWLRRTLSIWANRFLAIAARGDLSTLTSMVRVYDARFLRNLNLRSMGMDINPEIIHKTMLLRGRIEEIPAHLDWHLQRSEGVERRSSMRILRHTISVLLSGFLFRPFMFFIIPGVALFLLSIYANAWMLFHFFDHYQGLTQFAFTKRVSGAVALAFDQAPHTFIVGGMTLMLAVQLISLGILALQSKNYFEEIFHLGSSIYRLEREGPAPPAGPADPENDVA